MGCEFMSLSLSLSLSLSSSSSSCLLCYALLCCALSHPISFHSVSILCSSIRNYPRDIPPFPESFFRSFPSLLSSMFQSILFPFIRIAHGTPPLSEPFSHSFPSFLSSTFHSSMRWNAIPPKLRHRRRFQGSVSLSRRRRRLHAADRMGCGTGTVVAELIGPFQVGVRPRFGGAADVVRVRQSGGRSVVDRG